MLHDSQLRTPDQKFLMLCCDENLQNSLDIKVSQDAISKLHSLTSTFVLDGELANFVMQFAFESRPRDTLIAVHVPLVRPMESTIQIPHIDLRDIDFPTHPVEQLDVGKFTGRMVHSVSIKVASEEVTNIWWVGVEAVCVSTPWRCSSDI